jgi:hypothetical protein
MAMLVIIILFALFAGIIVAIVASGTKGEPTSPRYAGEAPHKGPVMRFTGTSSQVKEDTGNQKTTHV